MNKNGICQDSEKALRELLEKYHIDSPGPFQLDQKNDKAKTNSVVKL